MIRYVKGDATAPQRQGGVHVIVHVCNDTGGWGAGFSGALSARWPEPEQEYRAQFGVDGAMLRLGETQLVDIGDKLWVANCVAQHGYRRPGNLRPLRDAALESCLALVAKLFAKEGAVVHMPRIGCGLAGGTWEEVEPIINRTLVVSGMSVMVYDL